MIGFKDFLSHLETPSVEEGESLSLPEAISYKVRRQRSIAAKKYQQKLKRARAIRAKRPATLDRLKRRGRRSARDILTKRYYGGKSKASMSVGQKQRAEKRLDKASPIVGRISKRLLPTKRRLDVARRSR